MAVAKPYARPADSGRRIGVTKRGSLGSLFLTFGLAATIAGLFGTGNEIAKERYELSIDQCHSAEQLLLDETPSPYLSHDEGVKLATDAARTLHTCLKE